MGSDIDGPPKLVMSFEHPASGWGREHYQFDYETIGALFSDVYMGVHEITIVEKIWEIVTEVVAIVAE